MNFIKFDLKNKIVRKAILIIIKQAFLKTPKNLLEEDKFILKHGGSAILENNSIILIMAKNRKLRVYYFIYDFKLPKLVEKYIIR